MSNSLWDQIYTALLRGLVDAVSFHRCLVLVVRSAKIRVRLIECVLLNGFIFLGSIVVFNYAIRPLLIFALTHRLGLGLAFEPWIEWTYFFLWIAPVYILSFVLNAFWYQDISTESVEVYPRKPGPSQSSSRPLPLAIAEIIHQSIFNACFFLFLAILRKWTLLYLVNLAWLIAYTSFEYRWNQMQLSFESKIVLFETNWIYFLFFGLPLALIAVQFPSIVENGLISLSFPFLLMMSSTAARPTSIRLPAEFSRFLRWMMGWIERFRVLFFPQLLSKIIVFIISKFSRYIELVAFAYSSI